MTEKKKGRRGSFWKRFAAVFMAVVMIVTLFPVLPNAKDAFAATVNDFAVTINFYEFDQTTPKTPALDNGGYGQNYHVVISLTEKETGAVAGYGFVSVPNINQATQTLHITRFWNLDEQDQYGTKKAAWHGLNEPHDDKECSCYFDTEKYEVSGMRLYYGDEPDYEQYVWNSAAPYSALIRQTDHIDGYLFKDSSFTQTAGEINLYEGHQAYEIALNFDPDMDPIAESDGYYILVSARHDAGNYSYYYRPLVTDGSNPYKIRIKNGTTTENGDWTTGDGNPTKEKYTGNWNPVTVTILRAKEGETPNLNSALQRTNISEVTEVNGYSIDYETVLVKDTVPEEKTVYNCENVDLTKIKSDKQYTLFSILGDSINYGVTTNTMGQSGHSETNFAANYFAPTGNVDPDLSGDGKDPVPGNFLLAELADGAQMTLGEVTPATPIMIVPEDYANPDNSNTGRIFSSGALPVYVTMTKEEISGKVNSMIAHMQEVSADMIDQPATISPSIVGGNLVIDTSSMDDNATIYVNADDYLNQIKAEKGVIITKKPGQIIVFNFRTASGKIDIGKIVVNGADTDTKTGQFLHEFNIAADKVAQQVVWNFASPAITEIDLFNAGGMFLNPNDGVTMDVGGTSCGWVINAGHTVLGTHGEFHFVYQGLKPSAAVELLVYKTVDGKTPTSDQKFEFLVEVYDETAGDFKAIQRAVLDAEGKPTGDTEDMIEENLKGRISFEPTCEDGTNIYRITEVGKSAGTTGDYELDTEKVIYASVKVSAVNTTTGSVKVPGGVTYYGKFESGVLSERLDTDGRTFKNTKSVTDKGKLTIEKTFGGPVVAADLETLSFEVVNNATGKKTVLTLKKHFEKVSGSGNTYKLKEDCELPLGSYTVTEKNYNDVTGAEVAVSYKVGEGSQAVTGTGDTADFALDTKDQTVKVAFTDDYKGTDVKISKMSLGGNEIEGALLTLSGNIGGENGPAFEFTEDNFTQKNYLVNGFTHGTEVRWISGTSAMEVKDLPNGVYTLHEVSAPLGYEAVTNVIFVVNNGKVTVKGVEQTGNQVYMVDDYEAISVPVEATKSYKDDQGQDIALQGEEFVFVLKNSSGTILKTVKNDADGKVSFGSLDFETTGKFTYTIEEVPGNEAGVTYDNSVYTLEIVVFEKANGVGGLGFTRTFKKGTASADSIVFSNTRVADRVGKFTITKTFGGQVVESDRENLRFEVRKDGETTGTEYFLREFDYDADTDTWSKTFTLKNDELGKYYITEKNYDDSGAFVTVIHIIDTLLNPGANAVVTIGAGDDKVVAFSNFYHVFTDVKISKKAGSADGSELAGAVLTLSGDLGTDEDGYTGGTVDFTNVAVEKGTGAKIEHQNEDELQWTSGTTLTQVKDLPNGYYQLHEVTSPDEYGFAVASNMYFILYEGDVYTVTEEGKRGAKVADSTVVMVDAYLPVDAELQAEKSFKEADDTAASMTADQFRFCIRETTAGVAADQLYEDEVRNAADGTVDFGTFTYTKAGTYTYEISEVPGNEAGIEYSTDVYIATVEVTETATGLKAAVTYTKGGQQASPVFTNKKKAVVPDTAKLSIVKTFGGPVVEADLDTLSFEVENTATHEKKTFTLKENFEKQTDGSYKLKTECELELGSYTVTEKNYNKASGVAVEVTYQVGNESGSGDTAAVTLTTKDEQVNAVFNNEYPEGSLIITKTFGGPVVEADKQYLKFHVTGAVTGKTDEYTLADFTENDGVFTLSLPVVEGGYTITETNYNEASHENVEVSYRVNGGEKTVDENATAAVTVTKGTDTHVDFTNTYPDKVGRLTITKTFGGPVVEADKESLSFEVKNETTGVTKSYKLEDFDYDEEGDIYSLTIVKKNGELGEYTVTEKNYDSTGAQVLVTYRIDGGNKIVGDSRKIEIADGSNMTLAFDDDYPVIHREGKLIITKTFGGPVVEEDKKTLSFEVKKEGETEGTSYRLADFTYDEKTETYTLEITLKDDELGKYTVTEKNYNAASGVAVEVSYRVDGGSKTVGKTATVSTADGKTATAAFNNEYPKKEEEKETGKLSVHVIEEKSGRDVHDAVVEVTDEEGTKRIYITNNEGIIVDEDGNIPIVPAGKYTVVVKEVPTGYDVKTGETGTVTVPKDGEGHHDAVIATDRGGIEIIVLDEDTNEPVENAEVKVITPGGVEKTFITDAEGKITEYAKKDEYGNYTAETGTYVYTVLNVPEGYRVTVGEEQEGVVETGKLTELEAKIAPRTGGLDILVIDEVSKNPVTDATVEIVYPDGTTHTFVTDKDGKITELTKKDIKGRYTARVGTYIVTVLRVPEGYTVTTGVSKKLVVETDTVKHHVAEIATVEKKTEKTKDRTVQTGDDTPITMLFVLMLISAGGFAGVVVKKKKQKNR